jgi:hypothetical protein
VPATRHLLTRYLVIILVPGAWQSQGTPKPLNLDSQALGIQNNGLIDCLLAGTPVESWTCHDSTKQWSNRVRPPERWPVLATATLGFRDHSREQSRQASETERTEPHR